MKTSYNIVVFTNHSQHGREILDNFKKHNIPVQAIVLENRKKGIKTSRWQNFQNSLQENGVLVTGEKYISRLLRMIKNRILPQKPPPKKPPIDYTIYTDNIHYVNTFNAEDCQHLLEQLEPDILVLAGSRIIREHILNIPRIVTLNAHPGLLPDYRGVDVIPWAIYNDGPIGVTVHIVDTGVDTGNIILKREIPIQKGDTIPTLRRRAEVVAGEMMAEVVLSIIESGGTVTTEPFQIPGKQYYRMTPSDYKIAEQRLHERQSRT